VGGVTAQVYDPRLFALRRSIRMSSQAGPETTKQAERMALRTASEGHSVANALSKATRYLRSVRTVEPKGAA
jgi:predicted ABC-type ATPase